jgi:hypothetical protein
VPSVVWTSAHFPSPSEPQSTLTIAPRTHASSAPLPEQLSLVQAGVVAKHADATSYAGAVGSALHVTPDPNAAQFTRSSTPDPHPCATASLGQLIPFVGVHVPPSTARHAKVVLAVATHVPPPYEAQSTPRSNDTSPPSSQKFSSVLLHPVRVHETPSLPTHKASP